MKQELQIQEVTLPLQEQMQVLAEPLKKYGIHYFTLHKRYPNGLMLRLTTHGNWLYTFAKEQFHKIGVFDTHPRAHTTGWILWSELKQEPIYTTAKEFNIANGITLIKRMENTCEFYSFAGEKNNVNLPQFYLSHRKILENHIHYFRAKAKPIIRDAYEKLLSLHGKDDLLEENIFSSEEDDEKFKNAFSDINKYYVNDGDGMFYLTKRQVDIVSLLRLGKTTPAMAKILSISERTCEEHLRALRNKFKCRSLLELGFKLGILDKHKVLYR